jgi:polar amino acid transport system substrate-binding protein
MDQKCVRVLMLFLLLVLPFNPTALGQSESVRHLVKQKLIVGVTSQPPYAIQEEDGTWSGITVDLWKEIAGIIDVDYVFRKVDDQHGILSGLEDGTLDVGATPLSVTSAREEKFDFTYAYLPSIEAVAVNTDQQANVLQLFRAIFQNWGFLTFVLLMIGLTVAGAAVLWLLEHKGDSEHYGGKTKTAFGKSLFWSTMLLAGREFPKAIGWNAVSPTTRIGRLFGIIWMMVGIMLISLLTAKAASVLTSMELHGTIHGPDDLHHVTVGAVAPSIFYDYLKDRNIRCNHLYAGPVEMLNALADHKCDAVVWDRNFMLYYARTQHRDKIVVLNFPLRQDFLAIPLRRGSHLTKSINRAMLHVIESKKWQTILSAYLGSDRAN